jgi:hypothetical protein
MANDRPKPVVKKAFTPRDTSKPMPKPAASKQVIKIDSSAKSAPKSDKGGLKAANKPLRSNGRGTGMRISNVGGAGGFNISGGGGRPGQVK